MGVVGPVVGRSGLVSVSDVTRDKCGPFAVPFVGMRPLLAGAGLAIAVGLIRSLSLSR